MSKSGESETWQYDAAGNLTRHSAFDGQTTRYAYDSNDRRTLTLFPDGSKVAVTYSASGEVESKTDANGKTTYAYDLQGRPIRQANPDGSVLTWAYDAAGNLIERSSPQGTTRYAYDDANRLIKTTDPQGKVTRQTWNATGQPTQVSLPNGTETRFEYDPDGRLVQQTSRNSATGRILAATRYTVTGGLRTKVETYDGTSSATEAGSGLQLADPATTQTYTYDALKRLTRETRTVRGSTDQWTTTWAYDKVGNRSQQTVTLTTGTGTASEATTTLDTTTYTYDNNDRLTETTKLSGGGTGLPTTYAWDANGNLSKKQTPSETTLYGWDTENRLIEVKRGSSEATATTVATYRYDADGNRIQKTEPGSAGNPDKVTSYLVDSTFPYAQTVEETVTQGSRTESTHYVWGTNLIKQTRSGQGSYYHADAQGSVKALTDDSGNATDSYEYSAFGELTSHTGTTENPHRYTGEDYDETVGLQYNRARWYDASVGRWTAMDAFQGLEGEPETQNKYTYAGNNPIDNIDPTGLMTLVDSELASEINGILSSISTNLSSRIIGFASSAKLWKISTFATSYPGTGFHMYMGAEGPLGRFRYDVGLTRRIAALALRNKFSAFGGRVSMQKTDRFEGRSIWKIKMNSKQWLSWSMLVIGTPDIEAVLAGNASCSFSYRYATSNCTTWTIGATLKAIWVAKFIK